METEELTPLEEIFLEKQEMENKPFREGDFGHHVTYVGKITYRRPKHFFLKSDWTRIGKKFLTGYVEANDEEMPVAPWWMKTLRDYTLEMMEDIFEAIPTLKAFGSQSETIYNEVQRFSTDLGLSWADKAEEKGYTEAAALLRAAFRPYSFTEAATRP